jgi:type IV pilus assembly protein PilC
MPRFRYQALNADGQLITGGIEADGVQEAVAQLQSQGFSVQSIGFASSDSPIESAAPSAPSRSTVKKTAAPPRRPDGESIERSVLRSHMSIILERGRAIAPALRAYAEEMPNGWQRRQLLAVCRILERGEPSEAADALSALPECWIPLLSAATSSADLGHVLHEFLTESRRTDELRQKWWLTLAYPLTLLGLVGVVLTALSIFVIPQFQEIFAEFQLELPEITFWVLSLASFLEKWGVLILIFLAAVFVLLVLNANRLLPTSTFTWLADRLRAPFGRRTAIARFARFMADLLEAGVSMPEALRIAGFTVNRSAIRHGAWQLASDIETNGDFSQLDYQRLLTATVAYALADDTPSASRVRLLREISDCHAERIRIGLSWTTGIIEPLAICVVGFAVGCVVVALFLPLVKLVNGLAM